VTSNLIELHSKPTAAIPNLAGRGLFLDLDGTLADSLGVLRRVYFRFLKKFGRTGSDLEFRELNGPNLGEIVSILRTRHGLPAQTDDLLAIYNQLIDDAYRDVLPLPGALELLETAAKKGWTLVLVTSNLRARAQAWLAGHGFSTLLQMLISSEEVKRGKPFPDLYQHALSRSGCVVADSIAVEDSPQGAQAALSAGLRTFVIRSQIEKTAIWPRDSEFIHRWEDLRTWI
jgi:HAD superfamily hydrolase (TIGR01509 family)